MTSSLARSGECGLLLVLPMASPSWKPGQCRGGSRAASREVEGGGWMYIGEQDVPHVCGAPV